MADPVERAADGKKRKVGEDWASAAYHLFATGMMMPLGADIEVRNSGFNLPDADLDSLCDAIMGEVGSRDA